MKMTRDNFLLYVLVFIFLGFNACNKKKADPTPRPPVQAHGQNFNFQIDGVQHSLKKDSAGVTTYATIGGSGIGEKYGAGFYKSDEVPIFLIEKGSHESGTVLDFFAVGSYNFHSFYNYNSSDP